MKLKVVLPGLTAVTCTTTHPPPTSRHPHSAFPHNSPQTALASRPRLAPSPAHKLLKQQIRLLIDTLHATASPRPGGGGGGGGHGGAGGMNSPSHWEQSLVSTPRDKRVMNFTATAEPGDASSGSSSSSSSTMLGGLAGSASSSDLGRAAVSSRASSRSMNRPMSARLRRPTSAKSTHSAPPNIKPALVIGFGPACCGVLCCVGGFGTCAAHLVGSVWCLCWMFCQKNVNVYTIDKVAGDIREALRYEQEQLLDDITYLQVKRPQQSRAWRVSECPAPIVVPPVLLLPHNAELYVCCVCVCARRRWWRRRMKPARTPRRVVVWH